MQVDGGGQSVPQPVGGGGTHRPTQVGGGGHSVVHPLGSGTHRPWQVSCCAACRLISIAAWPARCAAGDPAAKTDVVPPAPMTLLRAAHASKAATSMRRTVRIHSSIYSVLLSQFPGSRTSSLWIPASFPFDRYSYFHHPVLVRTETDWASTVPERIPGVSSTGLTVLRTAAFARSRYIDRKEPPGSLPKVQFGNCPGGLDRHLAILAATSLLAAFCRGVSYPNVCSTSTTTRPRHQPGRLRQHPEPDPQVPLLGKRPLSLLYFTYFRIFLMTDRPQALAGCRRSAWQIRAVITLASALTS
jgi:hypothetical protein